MKNFSKRTLKSFRCLAAHSSLQYSIIYHFRYIPIYITVFNATFGTTRVGPAGGAGVLGDDDDVDDKTQLGVSHLVGSKWQQLSKAFRFFLLHLFFFLFGISFAR